MATCRRAGDNFVERGETVAEVDGPGPRDKAELLVRLERERAAWDALLAKVPREAMARPGVEGDWSVKDVVAHVMAYERWTAAQLRAEREGRRATDLEQYGTDDAPAIAEATDLDERNAAIHDQHRALPADEVLSLADQIFAELKAVIEALTEEELANPDGGSWWPGEPLLEVIPVQTYRHYHQHRPSLEAWIEGVSA